MKGESMDERRCGSCCYWEEETLECHRDVEAWIEMNHDDMCSRWEVDDASPINEKEN